MKRPSRRFILKAAILLIAGATLNVAVAWGLAMWSTVDFGESTFTILGKGEGSEQGVTSNNGWGRVRKSMGGVSRDRAAGIPRDVYPESFIWTNHGEHCVYECFGWPVTAICFRRDGGIVFMETQNGTYPLATTLPNETVYGIQLQRLEGFEVWGTLALEPRALPLLPLWPGFAINTLFYAGVLWMLFCGPFALRRMISRRRGRCAQCAYPIGTSEVCTECGVSLPPRGNASRSR